MSRPSGQGIALTIVLYIVCLNPTSARLWWRPCGVAWDAVPDQMVEYINKGFFNRKIICVMYSKRFNNF